MAVAILQLALLHHCTDDVRERGAALHRSGLVKIVSVDDDGVQAIVGGKPPYDTDLFLDGALQFHCHCPGGASGDFCEHAWALAIGADALPAARKFREDVLTTLGPSGGDGGDPSPVSSPTLRGFGERDARRYIEEIAHQRELARWRGLVGQGSHPALERLRTVTELWYLIDPDGERSLRYEADRLEPSVSIRIVQRARQKRGGLAKPTQIGVVPSGPHPGGAEGLVWSLAKGDDGTAHLDHHLARQILPELAGLGRLGLVSRERKGDVLPLEWDANGAWRVALNVEPASEVQTGKRPKATPRTALTVVGSLERSSTLGQEFLPFSRITQLLPAELLLVGNQLLELAPGHGTWVQDLLRAPLRLKPTDLKDAVRTLAGLRDAPRFANPEALGWETVPMTPEVRVRLTLPGSSSKLVRGTLSFRYGNVEVGADADTPIDGRRLLLRDFPAETAALARMTELGVDVGVDAAAEPPRDGLRAFALKFDAALLPKLLPELLGARIRVEVEGKPYRRAGSWHPFIESELDWFDVKGDVDFEGVPVTLPELLRAVQNQERWIRLRDGSIGLLPEEWLDSLGKLAELVPSGARNARFHSSQAWLVDGALAGGATLGSDAGFSAMKAKFERFETISPVREPRGFRGELRAYQRLAVGWLQTLDELGFGGCLADDMGLGKTVVVLAWLARRAAERAKSEEAAAKAKPKRKTAPTQGSPRPSLIVVPKSLLFNWRQECERFTPRLKLLVHHGIERLPPGKHFFDVDVVLTSYGTLRRDAEALRALLFDYVILDEAHNIKNAWTESHKAARSLNSRRRLALTGTPVENHLGELWNLLTFLNPGVFQHLSHLAKALGRRRPSEIALERVILRSLKPFILRRTKGEVARDLPERVEQTIHVELSAPERKSYDELAEYYRNRILERRAAAGGVKGRTGDAGRQTAEVLEALLRLRQAACHPGLIDPKRADEPSAKLDVLLDHLEALRAEGHKALVFSQFTKLLGLIRTRLDQAKIGYAYLDGKTRDREREVRRFQTEPELGVFLISLKAGGVGLNLVAAEYVFLLDPWWNPASEAQAIDRAHRIGQERKVIAYRLLADRTVEEKVAALQDEKRELAAAIFGDTANFSAKFTREDLEALLG